ncbi:acyl-CoA dehydrogenase [Sciscionella marina]|uniref:acyl-CoA dehydrogenase family protein n=1 Tax=Sciscionella marina TaxID=508770 RepID=UPI00038098AF|nr:acyl-CoA dehydrogenase [Sciscionella marina]
MDIPEVPDQVEITQLRAVVDGHWAGLRERVREQLASLPHLGAAEIDLDRRRAQVYEQLEHLARSGAPQIGFPVEYGGSGDIGGAVVAIETLGMADLSAMVKAGVQWGLFGGAVELLGTRRHHERYLAEIMDLRLLGCFAMTETGHGSDVQQLRTTGRYEPGTGEFVIDTPDESARKDYIGNAAVHGRMAVVFGQLSTGGKAYGVHAWLVPIRDQHGDPAPGVTIEDCGPKEGLNGVDNGRLWFDHVRVPRAALLDHFGAVAEDGTYTSPIEHDNARFFTMLGTLIRGRVSVAGAAGAATKTALTIAVRYANTRRQFSAPDSEREVPLLDYLAHQRRLLPALARSYALHFAQEELVASLHRVQTGEQPDERTRRELESRAAGLKALGTWHASRTIQTCREACGGAGYLSENQLPRWQADIDVFTTFEGDNTVMLQLVAKGLLTGYRAEMHELGSLGLARLVANYAGQAIIERTAAGPLIERLVAAVQHGGDLSDRGRQLQLFEDRETHVLQTCARRLQRAESSEHDAFEVFNDAQDHVLRLAWVHIERIVLEANIAALERCADQRTRQLLERVCDLFVFNAIETDLAWFLGHNRLDNNHAKQVTGTVNRLCQALRAHAGTLIDGLGVPEACVLAPIATGAEAARQQAG